MHTLRLIFRFARRWLYRHFGYGERKASVRRMHEVAASARSSVECFEKKLWEVDNLWHHERKP